MFPSGRTKIEAFLSILFSINSKALFNIFATPFSVYKVPLEDFVISWKGVSFHSISRYLIWKTVSRINTKIKSFSILPQKFLLGRTYLLIYITIILKKGNNISRVKTILNERILFDLLIKRKLKK